MYPSTYTVFRDDKCYTIRSCNDALGVARGLFLDLKHALVIERKDNLTVIDGGVTVIKHRP